MDDITWITEEILTITDDFYNLNSIKVNKDKSALLKHQPDFDDDNNSVQLQFGLETINIQPNNYKESAHILGVWVNLDADRRFVIQQQCPTSFNHVITAEKLTVTQAKRREKASLSIDPVISEEEAIRLTEDHKWFQ
ncbi:14766_t:CDS:2 [Entrophospora sp. SA101]|nr:14766_t:CDS:2 [Entrophospora sp. SA101]